MIGNTHSAERLGPKDTLVTKDDVGLRPLPPEGLGKKANRGRRETFPSLESQRSTRNHLDLSLFSNTSGLTLPGIWGLYGSEHEGRADHSVSNSIFTSLISLVPNRSPGPLLTDVVPTVSEPRSDSAESMLTHEESEEFIDDLIDSCIKMSSEPSSAHLQLINDAVKVVPRCSDPAVLNKRHRKWGCSLLHFLCELKLLDAVKTVLKNPEIDVNVKNLTLASPLITVVQTNQDLELVQILLDRGAKAKQTDENGLCALDYAAKYMNGPLFELLCRGTVTVEQTLPVSVLKCASEELTEEVNGINDARSAFVRELLSSDKFDINSQDDAGDTIQMHFCRRSMSELVAFSTTCGADSTLCNYAHETALTLSLGKMWWSAISISAYERMWDALKKSALEEVQRIIKAGFDLNHPSRSGEYALVVAVQHSSPRVLSFLLTVRGVDVYVRADDGMTPLLTAAVYGASEKFLMLLHAGSNIHEKDGSGNTALHLLAAQGFLETTKAFLSAVLAFNPSIVLDLIRVENSEGLTPIMCADRGSHQECVNFLSAVAAAGSIALSYCRPTVTLMPYSEPSEDSPPLIQQPLPYAPDALIRHDIEIIGRSTIEQFYHCCKYGLVSVVKQCLRDSTLRSQVNTRIQSDIGGQPIKQTCLHVACKFDLLEVVKELLSNGADANIPALEAPENLGNGAEMNQDYKIGARPIHTAVIKGNVALLTLLIGSDVDVTATCDGSNALHIAAHSGNEKMVEVILNYNPPAGNSNLPACINALNKEGQTPLTVAAFKGHSIVVQRLLDAEADVAAAGESGETALYAACQNGYTDIANLLLSNGADVNNAVISGNTVVHAAVMSGNIQTLDLLLLHEALCDIANTDGVTPLYLACEKGHAEMVKLLIGRSASINAMSNQILTPLHVAAYRGHFSVVSELLEVRDIVIDAVNFHGETPLYLAAQNGNVDTVKLLLTKGADSDRMNSDGYTALSVASRNGHVDSVRALLGRGVTIDTVDHTRATPLWWACYAGHIAVVRLLLAAGANADVANRGGLTPFAIAVQMRRTAVHDLLLSRNTHRRVPGCTCGTEKTVLYCPCYHMGSCFYCYSWVHKKSGKCPCGRLFTDVITGVSTLDNIYTTN